MFTMHIVYIYAERERKRDWDFIEMFNVYPSIFTTQTLFDVAVYAHLGVFAACVKFKYDMRARILPFAFI